jgi:hypothetical protein
MITSSSELILAFKSSSRQTFFVVLDKFNYSRSSSLNASSEEYLVYSGGI